MVVVWLLACWVDWVVRCCSFCWAVFMVLVGSNICCVVFVFVGCFLGFFVKSRCMIFLKVGLVMVGSIGGSK